MATTSVEPLVQPAGYVPGFSTARTVWIDLDNTPHVPFFRPIIRALEARGIPVLLTAREAFQVRELVEAAGMPASMIGRHSGGLMVFKVFGLFWRAVQLLPTVLRSRPNLALSLGSRSQILVGRILGVPTVAITDYEHSREFPFTIPTWELAPDAIPPQSLNSRFDRIYQFSGLKEDVYAPDLRPDPSILDGLGIARDALVVTVRPPATEAHYHNPESEILLERLMDHCLQVPGVRVVLLPRNRAQGNTLMSRHPRWFARQSTVIPPHALDGMNLIWHSDLVVSGGGTMNREAAALGVPVYSIFRGKPAAIDLALERAGRLVVVRTPDEVVAKIRLQPRDKSWQPETGPRPALRQILEHLEFILAAGPSARTAVSR